MLTRLLHPKSPNLSTNAKTASSSALPLTFGAGEPAKGRGLLSTFLFSTTLLAGGAIGGYFARPSIDSFLATAQTEPETRAPGTEKAAKEEVVVQQFGKPKHPVEDEVVSSSTSGSSSRKPIEKTTTITTSIYTDSSTTTNYGGGCW